MNKNGNKMYSLPFETREVSEFVFIFLFSLDLNFIILLQHVFAYQNRKTTGRSYFVIIPFIG